MSSNTEFEDAGFRPVSNKPNASQNLTYLVSAFYTAAVPIYLFHALLDLPFEEYWILFLIVTAAAGFVLSQSYHKVFFWRNVRLSHQREKSAVANLTDFKTKEDKKEYLKKKKESTDQLTTTESLAYALFFNNAVFLGTVIALSLVIFVRSSPIINYVISLVAAAGVVTLVSLQQQQQ